MQFRVEPCEDSPNRRNVFQGETFILEDWHDSGLIRAVLEPENPDFLGYLPVLGTLATIAQAIQVLPRTQRRQLDGFLDAIDPESVGTILYDMVYSALNHDSEE